MTETVCVASYETETSTSKVESKLAPRHDHHTTTRHTLVTLTPATAIITLHELASTAPPPSNLELIGFGNAPDGRRYEKDRRWPCQIVARSGGIQDKRVYGFPEHNAAQVGRMKPEVMCQWRNSCLMDTDNQGFDDDGFCI